jgi:hypothetical protein
LRRHGLTYGEIRALIPVPKSTLSGWLRDIRLSAEQVEAIKARTGPGTRRGIPIDTQWRRRDEIRAIVADARTFARARLEDSFFVAGVVLYWGEGSKTRNFVDLTNSDPAALRLFIAWVRAYLGRDTEFQLGLHLHQGNDEEAAKRYWRGELRMPGAPFGKSHIKAEGTGHRKNHLPFGVCRVRTRRAADNWHRVMAWIEIVASELRVVRPPDC